MLENFLRDSTSHLLRILLPNLKKERHAMQYVRVSSSKYSCETKMSSMKEK